MKVTRKIATPITEAKRLILTINILAVGGLLEAVGNFVIVIIAVAAVGAGVVDTATVVIGAGVVDVGVVAIDVATVFVTVGIVVVIAGVIVVIGGGVTALTP